MVEVEGRRAEMLAGLCTCDTEGAWEPECALGC